MSTVPDSLTYESISEHLLPERAPYVLAAAALSSGEPGALLGAIDALDDGQTAGIIRPPIPSILASRVGEVVAVIRSDQAERLDIEAVRLLVASVVDVGFTRYATDPSHQERTRG